MYKWLGSVARVSVACCLNNRLLQPQKLWKAPTPCLCFGAREGVFTGETEASARWAFTDRQTGSSGKNSPPVWFSCLANSSSLCCRTGSLLPWLTDCPRKWVFVTRSLSLVLVCGWPSYLRASSCVLHPLYPWNFSDCLVLQCFFSPLSLLYSSDSSYRIKLHAFKGSCD